MLHNLRGCSQKNRIIHSWGHPRQQREMMETKPERQRPSFYCYHSCRAEKAKLGRRRPLDMQVCPFCKGQTEVLVPQSFWSAPPRIVGLGAQDLPGAYSLTSRIATRVTGTKKIKKYYISDCAVSASSSRIEISVWAIFSDFENFWFANNALQ